MPRSLVIAAIVMSGSLGLAGCATFDPSKVPALPAVTPLINLLPAGWQDKAKAVQQRIVDVCGWSEPLENLASIAATFVGLGGVTAIGNAVFNAVCNSVKAKGVRYGVARPRAVRGVVLGGGFVR